MRKKPVELVRLQKFMAEAGVASRRHSEELIISGKVSVNGRVVDVLGSKIDPSRDRVTVDGQLVEAVNEKVVYILNKPKGFVTTRQDELGRRTVMELLPDIPGLHPVGRLDRDTSGLLLLTNDGDLTQAISHPSNKVKKTYRVSISGLLTDGILHQLANGVKLEDGVTAPAIVTVVEAKGKAATLEVSIYEGRNRQIRRMIDAVGLEIVSLKRIRLAHLTLAKLSPGACRRLSKSEVRGLYDAIGLA